MIQLDIPGRGKMQIENVVFDYNGTIATDGILSEEIKVQIRQLKNLVNIYILTADTHGSVKSNCQDLDVEIIIFPQENANLEKKKIVQALGKSVTACVGNGFNDQGMANYSLLFVCVLGEEGCFSGLLPVTDVLVKSTRDALNLFLNPKRLIATLRG